MGIAAVDQRAPAIMSKSAGLLKNRRKNDRNGSELASSSDPGNHMAKYLHAWTRCWFTVGMVAAGIRTTTAVEEPWENLPNGVLGRLANFKGEVP